MSTLESANKLAGKVWAAVEHTEDGTTKAAAALIDADRNAVTLAALDEFEELMLERHRVTTVANAVRYALLTLRAKHAVKP